MILLRDTKTLWKNVLFLQGEKVHADVHDGAIRVRSDGSYRSVPFGRVSEIFVYEPATVSQGLISACGENAIPMYLMGFNGRVRACVWGPKTGNVLVRLAQYRIFDGDGDRLFFAKHFVVAKIHNQRELLMRHRRNHGLKPLSSTIDMMKSLIDETLLAGSIDDLMRIEARAARAYFGCFSLLVRGDDLWGGSRTKRPPEDPINACLSFFYSVLTNDIASACFVVGLDPQVGMLHSVRIGRNSLACDLVEELRSPFVDTFVLRMANLGVLKDSFFERSGKAVLLSDVGRKGLLQQWVSFLHDEVLHPCLDTKVRRSSVPVFQAKMLAAYLREEIADYPAYLV